MLAENKWYLNYSEDEITAFQLYESKLCMPFDIFHKAIEKSLMRSVWTHEFADVNRLQQEFEFLNSSASELKEKMNVAIADLLDNISNMHLEKEICENTLELQ